MIKIFVLTFLVLSIAAEQSSTSTIVTLKCQQVQTSVCESGFQYSINGQNENIILNQTVCVAPGQKCRPTEVKFDVQKCLIDYTNKKCQTQVCYIVPQRQVCLLNRAKCSTPSIENYSCKNCVSVKECSKCLFKSAGENTTAQETCLGQICTEGLAEVNTTISSCTNNFDFLGQQCSCCVVTSVHARFCSTNSEILSNQQILRLLKSQQKVKLVLALLLLILGLFY